MPSNSGTEFTHVLQERYPLGTSPEAALHELEANGFTCGRGRYRYNEQNYMDCSRGFMAGLMISLQWRVVIYLDKDGRIERLRGVIYWDGP